jgi:chromosome segregation ATPase
MRLFSAKEITKKKTQAESELIDRKIRLAQQVQAETEKLSKIKSYRDPQKEKLAREFEAFASQITERRTTLLKEIEALEARKEKALEPLDRLELELQEREQSVSTAERLIAEQYAKVEEAQEKINTANSFIREKAEELAQREYEIHQQEETLKKQKASITASRNKLEAGQRTFIEESSAKKLAILEQEKRNFEREQELEIIKKTLDTREKDLNNYKRQLDDQRATLDRAWNELRSKQQNNG